MRVFVLALAAAGAMFAQSAHAGVVLSDNFAGTAQGNWPGDSVFLSIPQPGNVSGLPSVDLVGPGFYDNLAYGAGNSVDLDGSTGTGFVPAGELQSIASLSFGNYDVQFLLAGNLRSAPNQTTAIAIGSSVIDVTPSSNTQPYTLYNLLFTGASGQVSFTDLGPATQQGDLLANVVVSTANTDLTPLPGALPLFAGGLGIIGLVSRRRKRGTAA